MNATVVRVIIADDHPTFRSGLRAVLATDPGIDVVGEASDGEQAIALAAAGDVDVVVMDLAMPGMGGVEATRQLTRMLQPPRVVVLSMSDADVSVFAALRAGAHGYLLKDAEPEEILSAVHTVADGRALFGARVADRVLGYFATPAAANAQPYPQLSGREREVLELLAQGRDNASIAKGLCLSQKTVRNHVSNVIGKLHADGRPEAIVAAREAGFGREPR